MATSESVVEAAIDGGALSLGYEKLNTVKKGFKITN